jgi:predicted nucleic acid-binding protein
MPVERFIDTNILLYAYNNAAGNKREIALKIVEEGWTRPGCNAISVQVLQEFYVNFVRSGQSHEATRQIIEDLSQWPVVDNTLERFGQGLELCRQFQTSLWDAMILSAAKFSGAKKLLTEDLNHGQNYSGIEVVNPEWP